MPKPVHRKQDRPNHDDPIGRRGTTVRVGSPTYDALRDLSRETGQSIQHVIALAVEEYRRHRILEMTNNAYAALREDPDEWREVLEERELWDRTLADAPEDE